MGLPSGEAGIAKTLNLMVGLARQYKTDLNIRTLAGDLTQPCAPKDRRAELKALHRFVRDSIRYVNDVDGVETLQTPVQTLRTQRGDCDDKATLLCSLAASVGYATRFCAIEVRDQGYFSHVMAQLKLGQGWINAETILPDVEIGWWPPDATQMMLAHV
jgi:transglutaminase-like putative cysteine protease